MKFLLLLLMCSTCAWALPKYGPNAVPLSVDPNLPYFQHHRAPDFWALVSYYLPQKNDVQCSAANFTMVLNAARDVRKMSSGDKLLTIDSFIADDTDPEYSAVMSGRAVKFDRTVVATTNLARVLREAVAKLGLLTPKTHVDFLAVDEKNKEVSRKAFHAALLANEKSSRDFLIINFEQGDLTGDPEGGAHVATVGAYDAKTHRVLIFDPDREWYGPYWSPEDKVFAAIADPRSDSKAPGWIYVKF